MVTLKQERSKQLKSQDSYFLTFPYNQKIVSTIKSLPKKAWLPESKEWEIPINGWNYLKNKFDELNIKYELVNRSEVIGDTQEFKPRTYIKELNIRIRASQTQTEETSFFISGPYNQDLLDFIRNKEWANEFNDKTGERELPFSYLDELKSYLIRNGWKYEIVDESTKMEPKEYRNFDIKTHKTKLYDYQKESVNFGLNTNKWLLFDGPGLGKTLQSITLAEELKERGLIKNCLVVAGIPSLRYNWKKEIEKHSNLGWQILGEEILEDGKIKGSSVKEKLKQLNKTSEFFTLAGVSILRGSSFRGKSKRSKPIKGIIDKKIRDENREYNKEVKKHNDKIKAAKKENKEIYNDAFDNLKYDMIIVDEIHVCKSPSSKQGAGLLRLKAPYLLGLTGTPILNSPLDCYNYLVWLEEEKSNFVNFKKFFAEYEGWTLKRFLHLDILKNKLSKVSMGRTSEEVLDLPEKVIIPEYLEMLEDHKKAYENYKKKVRAEYLELKEKQEALGKEVSKQSKLGLIVKLRQMTSDPSIFGYTCKSTKLERAEELIREVVNRGKKVVQFSTFVKPLKTLSDNLDDIKRIHIQEESGKDLIDKSIEFQNNESIKIWLSTWQKAGVGIDLYSASYMIFLDTPYNFGNFEQNYKRIHRIGQEDHTFIYNLICEGTYDEEVWDMVKDKEALSKYLTQQEMDDELIKRLERHLEI